MASDMTTGTVSTSTTELNNGDPAGNGGLGPPASPGHPGGHAPRRRRQGLGRAILAVVAVVGLIAFIAVRGPERAKADATSAWKAAYHFVMGAERTPPPPLAKVSKPGTFTGVLTLSKAQREAIGLNVVTVEPQSKAVLLELTGTTDFDQNTLAKVRPLFDARVTQVFKSTGQMVKKGDPLVELYSTNLAAAKIDFRAKYAQWLHDLKLIESRRPLVEKKVITDVNFLDTYLAEMTSRANYIGARDKLKTYGISDAELDALEKNIDKDPAHNHFSDSGDPKDPGKEVQDISRLIVRAPIDGMIVDRDVVSGNFYDDMAVLMVISPMDRLWVWGDVYEKDQADVFLGQTWDISFPNLDLELKGKIEHIAAKFDPNTRTLKIRASIPNPKKELKADQRVRATLEIPPQPGQTVIPRNALSVISGVNCCFVQVPGDPDKFVRKLIDIDQENHDFVVVRKGLDPGDRIVTNGSLILSQLYEDNATVSSGLPPQ